MAPHGPYYAKYVAARDGVAEAAAGSVADMLRSSPWLPSWQGDRLLTSGDGWVPVPGHSEVTARQSKFLASSCFHGSIQQFADNWSFLNLAKWPTAKIIVRMLKYQLSLPERVWSTADMTFVYQSLGWACSHERISQTNWGAELSPEASEVRKYLLEEPWIFLPSRRRGNRNPNSDQVVQGCTLLVCVWGHYNMLFVEL